MFGTRQAIGIDCSDDVWRVVTLRTHGSGYEITGVAEWSAAEVLENAEAPAYALPLIGQARVPMAGSLPARGCAFKTTSLPPGNPAELNQVVRFEAEHQFPLPLQDLVWGFTLAPEPLQRQHAVIVGARRTLIDEQLARITQSGANGTPSALLPAPLAAIRAIAPPEGTFVLLLVDREWCDLCLYDGERLLACRSVLAGDPALDGWATRIARELRPWIVAQEALQHVLLLGMVTDAIRNALAQAVELPVTIGDPCSQLSDPHQLLPAEAGLRSAYATAIGLARAVLERHSAPNLLPSHFQQASEQQRTLAWTLVGLVCLLLLLIPPTLNMQQTLHTRNEKLSQLQQQVRKLRRAAPPAPSPSIVAAGQTVAALRSNDNRPLEILRRLSAELPPGVQLSDFNYTRGKMVVAQGRADSQAILAEAMGAINRTAIFTQVMLNSATLVKDKNGHGYDFQLTCTLRAGDDVTLGASKSLRLTPRAGGAVR